MNQPVPEITVQEFHVLLNSSNPPYILDVRRPDEKAIADIGGDMIPLQELTGRISELEPYRDKTIVVYCHAGVRSAQAVQILQNSGFDKALNLKGGILAWSREIDSSIPTY